MTPSLWMRRLGKDGDLLYCVLCVCGRGLRHALTWHMQEFGRQLRALLFGPVLARAFAFAHKMAVSAERDGWYLYDPFAEYRRLGMAPL